MAEIKKINLPVSNAYSVKNKNNHLLIDTGAKVNNLKEKFCENNINIEEIDLIVVTHVHSDHTQNLYRLQQLSDATIISHKDGFDSLIEGASDFPNGTGVIGNIISSIGSILPSNEEFEPVNPDIKIESNLDLKNFGFNGKIIHTPGHTKDSLSVIIEDEHCFVGDTMFNIFPWTVYPIFANDQNLLKNSWRKIRNHEGLKNFYPGHGSKFDKSKFLTSYNNKI